MSTRLVEGGRCIDRRQVVKFQFNGKQMSGFAGDSLASALLANDQHLIGRSFKYHRPRGLVASGPEEPNGLVTVGEGPSIEPNRQATMIELYEGLTASSQNHFPSLEWDVGAVADLASRFLPAGFYYKSFMRPRRAWEFLFEPMIRRAAGLGRLPRHQDESIYEHFYVHIDLLVVGGGVAGLTVAKAAADAGARVLIVEQMPHWGGRTSVDSGMIDGIDAAEWVNQLIDELASHQQVSMLNRTTAFGVYDHSYVLALERVEDHAPISGALRQRMWRMRPKCMVIATGAIERPLCFQDNDRPGVMLASGIRDYLKNFAISTGDRTVVALNNDDGYKTAMALAKAGLEVPVILDSRRPNDGDLTQQVRDLGIKIEFGRTVSSVNQSKGRIRSVRICSQVGEGATLHEVDCESLAVSGGWSPSAHLWSQGSGKLIWDEALSAFRPDLKRPPLQDDGSHNWAFTAGAASGCLPLDQTLDDACDVARAVFKRLALSGKIVRPEVEREKAEPPASTCLSPSGIKKKARAKAWVDFQNDVKVSDLDLALQEGYMSSEHAKRYTTLGMATDQGKLSNVNGLMIMAESRGVEMSEVSPTTFRPPYTPVTLGAIAGDARGSLFKPYRKTNIDEWHDKNGAYWERVGADWRRPFCYLKDGEKVREAVDREALRVRQTVGIFDSSSLGKIWVSGPDAGRFLDMLYTGVMSTLPIGRCRYGLMCNENGFLIDDGVVARIDETSFLCHTTTGGSDYIHGWMEDWLQCEWWNWKVYTANLTEQFAQIVVAGPEARKLLGKLNISDIDAASLPFMSWADRQVGAFKTRIFRVSFSGELSFEIALPADQGAELWRQIYAAGQEFDIEPYGTEALHVLRAEKGFVMIGEETDGTVTPQDLGLDWAVSKKKNDFLGKRGQKRPCLTHSDRWKFVGLETVEARAKLPVGALALGVGLDSHGFSKSIGRVTSSYHSPILNRTIALGLVENGPQRRGDILQFSTEAGPVNARIVSPVFYDPEGTQLNA